MDGFRGGLLSTAALSAVLFVLPFYGFQPPEELYACTDRIKTPAQSHAGMTWRCPLAPYVPLRFYSSESASEQAYNSSGGVTRPQTFSPASHITYSLRNPLNIPYYTNEK